MIWLRLFIKSLPIQMVSYILINTLLQLKDILVSNYGPYIGKNCTNITKPQYTDWKIQISSRIIVKVIQGIYI